MLVAIVEGSDSNGDGVFSRASGASVQVVCVQNSTNAHRRCIRWALGPSTGRESQWMKVGGQSMR